MTTKQLKDRHTRLAKLILRYQGQLSEEELKVAQLKGLIGEGRGRLREVEEIIQQDETRKVDKSTGNGDGKPLAENGKVDENKGGERKADVSSVSPGNRLR